MSKVVLLLRQDPEGLPNAQRDALTKAFGNHRIEYRRIDPVDYVEHDKICAELKPDAVILPMERPIPSLAMEHGIPHIAFGPDSKPIELEPLQPKFKPFVP